MNKGILTPSGFQPYAGIRRQKHPWYYEIVLANGFTIQCSKEHPFITFEGIKTANEINKKTEIYTKSGSSCIKSKRKIRKKAWMYDVLNVGKDNIYYTNDILSHNCEFLGSSNTLVSATKLASIPWEPPTHSINKLDIYDYPVPKRFYVICVDPSEGQNRDYSAFVTVDITEIPYKIVAKFRCNKTSPLILPTVIYNVAQKYNKAHVLLETNTIGAQIGEILFSNLEYEHIFFSTTMGRGGQRLSLGFNSGCKLGVKTTHQLKSVGCANLKTLIESDKLLFKDREILEEFTWFVARYGSFAAEPGKNDDLAMSLVLFGWLTSQPLFKDLTDLDVREKILQEKTLENEEEVLPFGIVHSEDVNERFESNGYLWEVLDSEDMWDEESF